MADLAENLFSKDQHLTKVRQGEEEVSAGTGFLSEGFVQCSALLLVSPHDGVAFLKHVGPKPEANFAGDYTSHHFEENFQIFMDHVQKHGKRIVLVPTCGAMSESRGWLIAEIHEKAEERGIVVESAEPVELPSGNYKWDILYDPQGVLCTRHVNEGGTREYQAHAIPGVDPALFENSS